MDVLGIDTDPERSAPFLSGAGIRCKIVRGICFSPQAQN